MKYELIMAAAVLGWGGSGCAGLHRTESLRAENLRCQHRTEPLGIDDVRPHLSWTLHSDQRDQYQTAYQIQAASRKDLLEAGKPDLWDSGKVESKQTFDIVYGGRTPKSGMDCWWRVQVWDRDGRACGWSRIARWTMGLLEPSDWTAQWVGLDVETSPQPVPSVVQKAQWIWTEPGASESVPVGRRFFRKTFEVPADWVVKSARGWITADDFAQVYLNGHLVQSFHNHKVFDDVRLQDYLVKGRNVLAVLAANEGQQPNPAGLLAAVHLQMLDGRVLDFVSDSSWKASDKEVDGWRKPDFDDSDWTAAVVVGAYGSAPWQETRPHQMVLPPARYLRHGFSLADKPIEKARLYAASLGVYQLYLNGERIGEDFLSPGWTDYRKRIYYRTYDVGTYLRQGSNAVGAIVADGWYAGYVGFGRSRNHYGSRLRLLAQLVIDYKDGSRDVIATGPDWKASLGPIVYADLLQGEYYDSRQEMPGWSGPDFDDSVWKPVSVGGQEVQPLLQAAVSEPVKVFAKVRPVSVSEPAKGKYVFDMGQNFAGVVQIRVQGRPGQRIELRHGERLNPDGTVYTTNLRAAAAEDVYICSGKGNEVWQPMFTFHGFQYVEITGLDSRPGLDAVMGLAFSSDTPVVGRFECSNAMVNRLYSNIIWTQRMNFIDIPTDCPQRDERLGWTGDAQIYVQTACYNNDVHAFFVKWLTDLTDAQRSDGQFPSYAPLRRENPSDGGPAWAEAGIICPWMMYWMYEDRRLLETHYDSMKRFVEFSKNRCTKDLLPPKQFHCFGDWLHIDDPTPNEIIYMAYFGYSSRLMSQIADVLGCREDADRYQRLFEDIRAAFQKAYVQPDGRIAGDSQTVYVLAIVYDLLTPAQQEQAGKHLLRRIEERGGHLSTGFVGTKDLMTALSKIGRSDVAYRLLLNETFPSWGFTIRHGATSIWERWNGWTPEEGFADPGMNSFAHYSFGAVGRWLFEQVGGIRPETAGFESFAVSPQLGGGLTWAKTSYESIRGRIVSDWALEGERLVLDVQVPPNTTAKVHLPAQRPEDIREGGRALDSNTIRLLGQENGRVILAVPSGRYRFTVEPFKE
ncbi:MAG TPA: family 78 glycoside hydrolase catalytic domain [Anaerohalosphaeraceae bacterium]|nr:family 78 glycoside hydrolase catalytic domain [Anaerohalosphaeraceae bacterium]